MTDEQIQQKVMQQIQEYNETLPEYKRIQELEPELNELIHTMPEDKRQRMVSVISEIMELTSASTSKTLEESMRLAEEYTK